MSQIRIMQTNTLVKDGKCLNEVIPAVGDLVTWMYSPGITGIILEVMGGNEVKVLWADAIHPTWVHNSDPIAPPRKLRVKWSLE